MHVLTGALAVAAVLAGCGSGSYGADYLERDMPRRVDRDVARLTDVSCVRKTDRVFQCLATAEPTARFVRDHAGATTETISYEVTVDPDTGEYVTRRP